MKRAAKTDVVIVGGGVAGLWTRARLRRAGYGVVLLENRELGAGQTIASQGILHRGVKYALSAEAREASDQLASAQHVWREALAGRGEFDLSGTEILADRMHLWATGLLSKATGVAAGLAMRSEVRRLERGQWPGVFAGAPTGTSIWEVDELSVSAGSLVASLRDVVDGPIVRTSIHGPAICPGERGTVVEFACDGEERLEIEAGAVVLAAGVGNESLLGQAAEDVAAMTQRRPLHMVLMDGAPGPLFAHMPRPGSDKPRLTVTSGRSASGWCWYLGGDLAETGVGRSREEQLAYAKREVPECLGWLDLSKARWATFRIDRAEGKTEGGRRPDGPVVRAVERNASRAGGPGLGSAMGPAYGHGGHVIAVWPTKLALAPVAAGMVLEELGRMGVRPASGLGAVDMSGLRNLPMPGVAAAPWAWKELVWS